MAGFGARIVDPQDIPKFLNSPQTALFDKGRLFIRTGTRQQGIARPGPGGHCGRLPGCDRPAPGRIYQCCFADGHRSDRAQLRLLKRFTRRIILALDSDAAGDKATLRGLQIARQALDRESDPVFDARGLLGNEARLQADIRVTTLPEGWIRMKSSSRIHLNGSVLLPTPDRSSSMLWRRWLRVGTWMIPRSRQRLLVRWYHSLKTSPARSNATPIANGWRVVARRRAYLVGGHRFGCFTDASAAPIQGWAATSCSRDSVRPGSFACTGGC